MIPKKASENIEQIAKQQGIPEEHLSVMVNEYWKSLKEELVTPVHNCIKVIGMGRMRTSYRKMKLRMKQISEDETLGRIEKRNKLLPLQKLEEAKLKEWKERKCTQR